MNRLDTSRIDHHFSGRRRTGRIVVVGLGSGGFPVLQHLAMSGWLNFTLVDPDVLDEPNLVKHPALRVDLGRPKVAVAEQWLLDRNPSAQCEALQFDVMTLADDALAGLFTGAAIVVSATDSNAVRHFINDACVRYRTPMTVGLVHRGGVGGTILAYRPDRGGCYACMESVASGIAQLPSDDELPLSDEETEMIYGRDIRTFSAAGLSSDIALIAAIHAQMTIAELTTAGDGSVDVHEETKVNWVAVRIREEGASSLAAHNFFLPMIDNCVSCGQAATDQVDS